MDNKEIANRIRNAILNGSFDDLRKMVNELDPQFWVGQYVIGTINPIYYKVLEVLGDKIVVCSERYFNYNEAKYRDTFVYTANKNLFVPWKPKCDESCPKGFSVPQTPNPSLGPVLPDYKVGSFYATNDGRCVALFDGINFVFDDGSKEPVNNNYACVDPFVKEASDTQVVDYARNHFIRVCNRK